MTSSASSFDSRARAISCGSAIAGRARSEESPPTPSVTRAAYALCEGRSTALLLLVVEDEVVRGRTGGRDRPLRSLEARHLEREVERRASDRDVELPVAAVVGVRAELLAAVWTDPDAHVLDRLPRLVHDVSLDAP